MECMAVSVNVSAVVVSKACREHIECIEEQSGPHASVMSAIMDARLLQMPQAACALKSS